MAEWPGAWSGRGTRTQFRLGPTRGFLRGIHPVRGDIMDVGPSSSAAGLSAELVSSNKGTRTRTVREYEQTISELKKENFDLKLKIYMSEEGKNKSRKDKESFSQDQDNTVQVIVQLKLETESLQNELNHKDKLLQEAKNQVEKYAVNIKELTEQCSELQSKLTILSEAPTMEEFAVLLLEKENLLEQNKTLEMCLQEKNEEIELSNQRINILAEENINLEEKKKQRTLAIKSFLVKEHHEKNLLPDELRAIAISAVQAAKNGQKRDLMVAVKNFNAALCQCLEEQSIKKRCLSLPSQNLMSTDLSGIQGLEEFLSERYTPASLKTKSLDCFIQNSFLKGTAVSEKCIAEKDVVDFVNYSEDTPAATETAIPVSLANESQHCTPDEITAVNIENIFAPTTPPFSLNGSIPCDRISSLDSKQSFKLEKIMKENMQLKQTLENKMAVIEGLRHAYEELNSQTILKEAKQNYASEATPVSHVPCQTDASLSHLSEVVKLKNSSKLSDTVNEELKKDNLLLLLTIEEKNKELSDVKQALSSVQTDLNQALDANNQTHLNEDCVNERNELHERLAFSCSVNTELMKHLRNLEAFMEDLLQHKLDSSLESVSDRSSFFSNVSKCLNESLKLSNALSDHLSICEGSKLFEECKSILCRSQLEDKSFPHLDVSESSVPDYPAELSQGIQASESHLSVVKETYGNKDFGLFYGNMLCKKCCQQMDFSACLPELNQRHKGYPSSDSDIWSEPDRDVSMQRIGIDLKMSPTSSKSPRKFRSRDKRKFSTDHYSSSSDVLHSSRHKRNGSAYRQLFGKESSKHQNFMLEKYHFLISEKFSRLKSLLSTMKNNKNCDLTIEISKNINSVMSSLEETMQKLQLAKDHDKSFSPGTCGKCAVLELLLDLRTFPEPEIGCESSSLRQFLEEISLLKEECDEPFALLPREAIKMSRSIQFDPLIEQDKIRELEQMLVDLNNKNEKLAGSLNEMQGLLTMEKNLLGTVEAENLKLSDETKHLKAVILDLQNKRNELSVQNAELVKKFACLDKEKSELGDILETFEQTKKQSDAKLDQLTTELQKNKSELVNMSIKCVELEKELNEQTKQKEELVGKFKSLQSSSSSEIEKYVNEIENLTLTKSCCVENLEKAKDNILALEKEISVQNDRLNVKDNEFKSLLEKIRSLENSQETLSAKCLKLQSDLEYSEGHCSNLQEKCNSFEEEASQRIKLCEKYHEQLQQTEEKFLSEKKELMDNISLLTSERDTSMHELKLRKAEFEKLSTEKTELNKKLVQSCQQIATLKTSKENLEGDHNSVLLEKANIQSALLSSDSKCVILEKDLAQLKDTLQNLKSNCKDYEKELLASAGIKKSLVDCLLNINDELVRNRWKICKAYDVDYVESDKMSSLGFIPAIDEDSVTHLCDNISSESRKLLNAIDVIIAISKNYHEKSQEVQLIQDKYAVKINSIKKQMELQKREMEHLQSQNNFLKRIIEEKQKSICDDNEKFVQFSAFEIQSLKEKLNNSENEIEKKKLLLKTKDDEITTLQEKVFNLQTYINSMLIEKNKLCEKLSTTSMELTDKRQIDPVLPSNSLSPQIEKNKLSGKLSNGSMKSTATTQGDSLLLDNSHSPQLEKEQLSGKLSSGLIKLNALKQVDSFHSDNSLSPQLPLNAAFCDTCRPDHNNDDNLSSASSSKKNSCCDKYYKKCHSLQKKLALYRKQIQILEEEKASLREFQTSNSNLNAADNCTSKNAQISELESKLEQKKNFIAELKGELLKVCNSLIDKEREVDILKENLAKYETKSKYTTSPELTKHMEGPKTVDANIKNLTNYKWTLIQAIFDIQRSFYEGKGIHLNYFDQFKDHVNSLYSLQMAHTLSKSESLPLLSSLFTEQGCSDNDNRFKHLVGLELDIECLENLKIFLNRFFVPCVTSETFSKVLSSSQVITEDTTQKLKLFGKLSIAALPKGDEKPSIENFIWNISQHIEIIKDFFDMVEECEQFESLDFTSTVDERISPLLLNILGEVTKMHKGAKTLFSLNAALKELDVFPVRQLSKPDVSDHESSLSEETITISRSETPVSNDDICTLKLAYSPKSKLKEQLLAPQTTTERRGIVSSGKPHQLTVMTISSSSDSIHHRSQYSSPDLGIESDPNHESSVPDQKEGEMSKYQKSVLDDFCAKKSALANSESVSKWKGSPFIRDHLYAIGNLSHYELLKREIQECLVGIKSVLSRTGDGLHHIGKSTSPKKALEYSTLKAIKDTCAHIEVCLKEAYSLIGKFWTAHCPTEHEWNALVEENEKLYKQLTEMKDLMKSQETEFNKGMKKLEHAELTKAMMEKKISKKLVKTKKVIRQTELKLLETECQNCPPVPKYPLKSVSSLL